MRYHRIFSPSMSPAMHHAGAETGPELTLADVDVILYAPTFLLSGITSRRRS